MCSLKYWQAAFKNHTKEKTGILKAERLRDALLEVGTYEKNIIYTSAVYREKHILFYSPVYNEGFSILGFQLNTDVLSILILRYMRKDGTLRFGDFVSAILHLSDAFGTLNYQREAFNRI